MAIFIGSKAIKYWLPEFREPKDIDVVATELCYLTWDTIVLPQEIINLIPCVNHHATLDAVYTIKMSHLAWDIKWNKHKQDCLYLKSKGCELIQPLYEMLIEYWPKVHGNKPYLSLYQKKDDFFNDHVPYVYEHDYLHELVAHPNQPIYNMCLKDGESVAIDKEKFFNMAKEQQLRMFKEEVVVIAAERWLINPKVSGKYTWMEAYNLALHKTITQLTKGWASCFMIENLEYYVVPEWKYFEHLLSTVREGEKIMGKQLTSSEQDALEKEIALQYNMHEDTDDDCYFDLEDLDMRSLYSEIIFEGECGVKVLEQHGGEGMGEDYYCVFEFQGQTYKAQTWYASNHGVEWSDMNVYKVEAKQVLTTVYE